MVMEIRIRGYFRGEIEADAEVAGNSRKQARRPNRNLRPSLTGAGRFECTDNEARCCSESDDKISKPTYVPTSTGPLLPLNGRCGLRKSFTVLRRLFIFGLNIEGFLLRDNQIVFWYL